jgi:hypothetical protein
VVGALPGAGALAVVCGRAIRGARGPPAAFFGDLELLREVERLREGAVILFVPSEPVHFEHAEQGFVLDPPDFLCVVGGLVERAATVKAAVAVVVPEAQTIFRKSRRPIQQDGRRQADGSGGVHHEPDAFHIVAVTGAEIARFLDDAPVALEGVDVVVLGGIMDGAHVDRDEFGDALAETVVGPDALEFGEAFEEV